MLARASVVLALLAASAALAQATAGGERLLAGAQLFRAGRFNEAAVEFRVAEALGAGTEAAWYLGVSLARAGRDEEALEVFARAARSAPDLADPLIAYYRALSAHQLRLYSAADELLARAEPHAGPRLHEQVRLLRARLFAHLALQPPTSAIDWYHHQGALARQRGRHAAAALYFQEAALLSTKRTDAYRGEEAEASRRRAVAAATPTTTP